MVSNLWSKTPFSLKKNSSTVVLLAAAMGLAAYLKQPLWTFPFMVDWNTIVTLSGLLLITTGIKESGLFYLLACRISQRIGSERLLALFLIFLAAVLSMFLTNDIALFIVVPLTLHLQRIADSDYSRIIIFEAIAVNAGSSLTPVGNPQNIFLWHQWGISFPLFVREMTPLVLVMSAWLLVMTLFCFPSTKIKVSNSHDHAVDRGLFILSALMLAAFIVSTELGYGIYFLPVVFAVLMPIRKGLVLKPDWGLILLFIVIFIDLHLACQLKVLKHLFSTLDLSSPPALFLSGALFSQVISNVPSAILLAHHSSDYKMIAYGVNIGGNGLLIGSFANLIALRLTNKRSSYISFHVYSIPYFLITLITSCRLLI